MRLSRNWIESFKKYCAGEETSEKFQTWTAISVLASTLERKVWLELGHDRLYPNLYTFLVAPSGLVKKETLITIGSGFLKQLPQFYLFEDRISPGSFLRLLWNSNKFFQYQGKTIRQTPLTVVATEVGTSFGGSVKKMLDLLSDLYDCRPFDSSIPWSSKNTGKRYDIYGPCINLLGATTPTGLKRMIPEEALEGGLASRLLLIVETKPPSQVVAWPEINPEAKAHEQRLLDDLKQIYKRLSGPFGIDPEAKESFARWYEHHRKQTLLKSQDPRILAYLGKKPDLIRKLAMIYSASYKDELWITREDILWAGERLEEIEEPLFDLFAQEATEEEISYQLLTFINSHGQVFLDQIAQRLGRYGSKETLRAYLTDLRVSGLISEETTEENRVLYRAVSQLD